MTKDKWKDILGNIKDKFEILEHEIEHLDEEGGIDIEFIVFKSPLGKVRLEYVEKPVILDKKTTYSKRIGSETKVDYIYSEEEKSRQMIAYKWNEEDDSWEEMNPNSFTNL